MPCVDLCYASGADFTNKEAFNAYKEFMNAYELYLNTLFKYQEEYTKRYNSTKDRKYQAEVKNINLELQLMRNRLKNDKEFDLPMFFNSPKLKESKEAFRQALLMYRSFLLSAMIKAVGVVKKC